MLNGGCVVLAIVTKTGSAIEGVVHFGLCLGGVAERAGHVGYQTVTPKMTQNAATQASARIKADQSGKIPGT